MLNCPILLFTYKRPEETKKILKIILNQKPSKLYIFQDGPKENFSKNDTFRYKKTRDLLNSISKKKKITKFFFKKNIGTTYIFDKVLRKIFKREKKLIILEDDTLPKKSFFSFCVKLLIKYKNNKRISSISGCNLIDGTRKKNQISNKDSYFFSKYVQVWGWATWSDRWLGHYDISMKNWIKNKKKFMKLKSLNYGEKRHFKHYLSRFVEKKEPWDLQWVYVNLLKKRLTIVPKKNLIKNIGFESDPDGRGAKKFRNLYYSNIKFPLKHPNKVFQNLNYDDFLYNSFYNRKNILIRILQKIKKNIDKNL